MEWKWGNAVFFQGMQIATQWPYRGSNWPPFEACAQTAGPRASCDGLFIRLWPSNTPVDELHFSKHLPAQSKQNCNTSSRSDRDKLLRFLIRHSI